MVKEKGKAVVVTTAHRGVFFGLFNGQQSDTDKIVTLTEVQMCVYWSADVQGVMGLAVTGPSKTCKVTPIVPRMVLQDVTSIMDATEQATKAWRDKPWR